MRTILSTLVFLAAISGAALAADANSPLLRDTPEPTRPVLVADACGPCQPSRITACVVPNSCDPCSPRASRVGIYRLVEKPVKTVVHEERTVTVKKKVWDEEVYVAEERRIEVLNEVRTRTATRSVPVHVEKEVSEVKLVTVGSTYGSAPRLSRTVNKKTVIVPTTVKEEFVETYVTPVRHTVTVPVEKTRKVAREVEEVKTITVPVTVVTMETRLVGGK